MDTDEKFKLKNDIILIGILLVIACIIGIFVYVNNSNSKLLTVQVILDGDIIREYPLGDSDEYNMECMLETGNYVVIKDGEVFMKDANCPDKLCVKQGKISQAGETIICLPNRLVIKIIGDSYSETEGLDVNPR